MLFSSCHIKDGYYQNDLSLWLLTLLTWQKNLVRILNSTAIFLNFPFLHCTFWKRITMCCIHLQNSYLKLFCIRNLFLLPHVFVEHLYHYGPMNIYEYVFKLMDKLKLFYIWPLGTISVGSCVLLTELHHSGTFIWTIISSTTKCFSFIM